MTEKPFKKKKWAGVTGSAGIDSSGGALLSGFGASASSGCRDGFVCLSGFDHWAVPGDPLLLVVRMEVK